MRARHRLGHLPHLFCLVVVLAMLGCGGSKDPGNPSADTGGPADLPGAGHADVVAGTGATVTAAGGITAEIPAGALPEDMTVSLIPVRPPSDGQSVAAVRLEPEGTVLLKPVTVRLPLPADWPAGEAPEVLEFKGNDPGNAVPTGAYAQVTGTPGHYVAEILVSHFSGPVCAENCHAGTIRYLLEQYAAQGCSRDSLLAHVRQAYPDLNVPPEDCGGRSAEVAQAFLDTYFDDAGGFDEDYQIPASQIQQLSQFIREGRQVVLAFRKGAWGPRSGPHNFYATAADEYSHTVPLTLVNDQVWMHNTMVTSNEKLIQALGGRNEFLYRFDQVNEFRKLPSGVPVEMALCGEPGCLSDASRNQWGLDLFQPVDGVSYVGRTWSNPWDYIRQFGQGWSGIPPRSVPWTAVRIYVEKPYAVKNVGCSRGTHFQADISLPGYYSTHMDANSLIAAFGELNNVPGYPSINASPAMSFNWTTVDNYDFATVFCNKALTSPGSYELSANPVSPWSVILGFTTPTIRNAEMGEPTLFYSTSGTITFEEYSPVLGGRLKGTFTASLEGMQSVRVGSEIQDRTITGTASGSFEVVITDPGSSPRIVPRSFRDEVVARYR